MAPQSFTGRIVLPDRILDRGSIFCQAGRIEDLKPRGKLPRNTTVIDAQGGWIVPGFVDIHVHGADGADYMDGSV